MKSSAEHIKEMLEFYLEDSSGFALYPIFIGKQPATPFENISIFDVVGWRQDLPFNRDEIYERPAVQIRVISTNYEDGWAMINAIKNTLHGRAHETWGGVYYSLIRCTGGPAMLDFDKNQRVRFIVNFDIQRRF